MSLQVEVTKKKKKKLIHVMIKGFLDPFMDIKVVLTKL